MLIYVLLIAVFSWELCRNVYPDSYEKYINGIIIRYNSLKLQLEKNEILKEKVITISYNCIYFYSFCQIQYKKANDIISPIIKYLKDNNILAGLFDSKARILILIDENGNDIFNLICNSNSKEEIEPMCNKHNYTGMVLIDKNLEKGNTNYVFYDSFPETFDYTESMFNFISIQLNHEKKTHSIHLNKDCNYYIVGNSLNSNFFKYYLKNILKTNINPDNFDYTVHIIDHDAKYIKLLPHQSIIIGENDYRIVSPNNNITLDINDNVTNTNDELSDSEKSDKFDDFVKLDSVDIIFA